MNKNYVYVETYGCQMNLADTEVVLGILKNKGYEVTNTAEQANVVLINTCSIRDNAEQRIYGRLGKLKTLKRARPDMVLGVLGCMAERLRKDLIDDKKMVDLVVGPDEYRKLPEYIDAAFSGDKGIGVRLSKTETYDDIIPYREDGLQAWISVMRGCDKFCTFCVVPFTRGRERSRTLHSIVEEVKTLSIRGFREITLLGQNVNSYECDGHDFADLMEACAVVDPMIRIRFSTSHPQDLSLKLLKVIAKYDNICKYIHLPVQSGSNRILELMNRTYTIEKYYEIIDAARELMPDVSFSTDIISGFPTETWEDHLETINVLQKVKYDGAYMFKYSPREGTKAYRMEDDVPEETKGKRLQEIIDLQQQIAGELNQKLIGKDEMILVEGESKKSELFYAGRTDSNKMVVFPKQENVEAGDYVKVTINRATFATLFADFKEIVSKRTVDSSDVA